MRYLKWFGALVVALLLAACGGGGGSPGTTSGSGSGSGTTVTGTPSVVVSIHNAAGNAVNAISVGTAYVARATLVNSLQQPVANRLVTFSIGGASVATLTPQTALSNANGVAEVVIAPASLSSIGAATLSGSAEIDGATLTGRKDFAVQASSLELSALGVGSANLASGGNTSVQVSALIGGAPSTGVPVNVSFSVSCGKINGQDATGSSGVSVTTNGSGVATAVYDAVSANGTLCSGAVTLTASAAGATAKSTTVNVTPPTANAVVFVSATPAQIFVAGSGAVDQSIARFKVLSSAGTPMSNVAVRFSIVTNPGGVGLGSAGATGAVSATTNAAGEASVSVFSGTIPGPVKVRASLESNPDVFAESQNLTVASGPPSQRFMSLSVETFNIEGWSRDGTSTQLTARVADRQGNAVEDGTVVNFTSEAGQVARSCATTRVNGISQCSVSFQSQNPRPAGGRVSVLAYLEGTKDYVDMNGNNRYDPGLDQLVDQGDAYRDDNENATYDALNGEFLIPRSGTVRCAGAGAPFPSRVNTCDGVLATTVRQQAVILYSSTNAGMTMVSLSPGGATFRVFSADNPSLPMPSGTTVGVEAIDSNTQDGLACGVNGAVAGSPIPNIQPGTNPNADLATAHSVNLQDCVSGDRLRVRITAPSGLTTQFGFTIP